MRFCLWGNTSLTGKVTGTRSLTARAPHHFSLLPIPQRSIQATNRILVLATSDIRSKNRGKMPVRSPLLLPDEERDALA
jgi:hypothetical protein